MILWFNYKLLWCKINFKHSLKLLYEMLRKDWTRCTWLSTHLYKEIDGQMSCTRFSFCCLQFQQLLIPTRAICHTHPQSNRTWISAAFPESFSKFQRGILLPVTPPTNLLFCWLIRSKLSYKVKLCKGKMSEIQLWSHRQDLYNSDIWSGLLSLVSLFTVSLLCLKTASHWNTHF